MVEIHARDARRLGHAAERYGNLVVCCDDTDDQFEVGNNQCSEAVYGGPFRKKT